MKEQEKVQTLTEAEDEAINFYNTELGDHLNVSQHAYNIICSTIDSIPATPYDEMPLSMRIGISLLIRISNDLRCSSLLAVKGYPNQAATLVTSIYEAAITLGYISVDEERAKQWVVHDDPTVSINVKRYTKDALKTLGIPENDIETHTKLHYTNYRQLCMVKHMNPLFQKQQPFETNGPDIKENSIRTAWFSLEKSIEYSIFALTCFSKHIPDELQQDFLVTEFKTLIESYSDLHTSALERWGTKNPYPDKW
jgi:hypothetical protein